MNKPKLHTERRTKESALQLYGIEILQYETTRPTTPESAKAIAAVLALARERYTEIAASDESEFDIDMYYDRPKDVINCQNRNYGDDEV